MAQISLKIEICDFYQLPIQFRATSAYLGFSGGSENAQQMTDKGRN